GLTQVGGQIFNPDGTKSGSELQITNADHTTDDPSTTGADGRFIVVWRDEITDHEQSGNQIQAQVFDLAGLRSDDTVVINTTSDLGHLTPKIAYLADE